MIYGLIIYTPSYTQQNTSMLGDANRYSPQAINFQEIGPIYVTLEKLTVSPPVKSTRKITFYPDTINSTRDFIVAQFAFFSFNVQFGEKLSSLYFWVLTFIIHERTIKHFTQISTVLNMSAAPSSSIRHYSWPWFSGYRFQQPGSRQISLTQHLHFPSTISFFGRKF